MKAFAAWSSMIGCALLASACGDSPATPCDPFIASTAPIELGEILGVGRDAEGTLYVADRPDGESESRVFVSDGDQLVRKRVIGSGEGSEAGLERLLFTVEDTPEPFQLVIEIGAAETRMAIAPADEERTLSIDELGSDAELLEVLDESAVSNLSLRNLPGDVELEYFARTESGALLIVIRPADDFRYEDFRLFFGPEQRVLEREVVSVLRARDGGSTHIEFELDGEEAVAFFPVEFSGDRFTPGPATLTVGGETLPLERLEESELPGEAEFLCRQ